MDGVTAFDFPWEHASAVLPAASECRNRVQSREIASKVGKSPLLAVDPRLSTIISDKKVDRLSLIKSGKKNV